MLNRSLEDAYIRHDPTFREAAYPAKPCFILQLRFEPHQSLLALTFILSGSTSLRLDS